VDASRIAAAFAPDPGYLNTASLGVPPIATLSAVSEVLAAWQAGQLSPPDFDEHVRRARVAWASITGVDAAQVAISATVAELVGLIAAALPDGARVVTAQGEFTSLLFPFLAQADRGVVVDELPLET
jgi:selenocysteine lyase/cysteine desulfurase